MRPYRGLSGYRALRDELTLRTLDKEFDEKARHLNAILAVLPPDEAIANVGTIDARLAKLAAESEQLQREIEKADAKVNKQEVRSYERGRRSAVDAIRKLREKSVKLEETLHVNELEAADLGSFIEYLEELSEKLPRAQAAADVIGNIEFSHCPACLAELNANADPSHCVVCGAETDPQQARARYLQIKLDIDIQSRESRQLLEDKRRSSVLDRSGVAAAAPRA